MSFEANINFNIVQQKNWSDIDRKYRSVRIPHALCTLYTSDLNSFVKIGWGTSGPGGIIRS